MIFLASPQILFPVRRFGIDHPEGHQETLALIAARSGEPCIHAADIAAEKRFKASGPRLPNPFVLQLRHQRFRRIPREPSKRPLKQMHVGIDQDASPLACKAGCSRRRRLPPKIISLASSEMFAPRTFPTCEPKLRPPTSLP